MERRFVCINFERGTLSAYIALAGNRPVRLITIGGPDWNIRELEFDPVQIQSFRIAPTTFGGGTCNELPPPDTPMVA